MTRRTTIDASTTAVLRCEYLATLDALSVAHDQVRQVLDDATTALAAVRTHLEQGRMISDLPDLLEPKTVRTSLSRSLDELERARHRSQRALFRMLEAEGQRKSDIARICGVSRQLVSRIIHEPD